MRGENLTPGLKDTDPQKVGVPPLRVIAEDEASQNAADLFNQWVEKAKQTLADEPKANCVTLRGFATDPELIPYDQAYGLNAACVAAYPMYKGVAKLVGMEIVDF
ncbi:MAG: phosphoglycerate mutase, partial [Gammaproteobacteria bacterium]|nr:phosphoglycerate mutase [Gammaproteobacteria bacterium]